MFTFGIGSGVDYELAMGLARAGKGRCEFVELGADGDMRSCVLGQLER